MLKQLRRWVFGVLVLSGCSGTPELGDSAARLSQALAPSNDECATPTLISSSSLPFTETVDVMQATVPAGEAMPSCSQPPGPSTPDDTGRSTWYEFTAPSDGTIGVAISDPQFTVSIHTGTCGSLTEVDCQRPATPIDRLSFLASAGTKYLIEISHPPGVEPPPPSPLPDPPPQLPLVVEVDFLPAPSNNLCTAPNVITQAQLPFTETRDIGGATKEPGDPVPSCQQSPGPSQPGDEGRSIWYEFTAPSDGTIGVAISDPQLTVSIHTGSCGSLAEVDCQRPATPIDRLLFLATAGTKYLIQVSHPPGVLPPIGHPVTLPAPQIPLVVELDFLPAPSNNLCTAPRVVPAGAFTETLDIGGATKEPGDPVPSCSQPPGPSQPGDTGRSIWYEVTAPSDGTLSASVSDPQVTVSIHSGSCGSLTEAACGRPATPINPLTLAATAGTKYLIQVSHPPGVLPPIGHPVTLPPPQIPLVIEIRFDVPVPPNPCVPDVNPPTIDAPADINVPGCEELTTVSLGSPIVSDDCATIVPTAEVIARNGQTLLLPIPITGSSFAAGAGTTTIRWKASDGAHVVTDTQTVTVRPGMEVRQAFTLQDRAEARTPSNAGAALLNSGTGTVLVSRDAKSGGILGAGPVQVLERARVAGNITSPGTITVSSQATLTGSIVHAPVSLPNLPTLPTFPAAGTNETVNSGTRNLPPGSYNVVTVNGGTLVLAAGTYYFRTWTVNSGVTVRAQPTTRIYVMNTLAYRSPITNSSGARQPVLLGFAGTSTVLEAGFDGALVAPNAQVSFGIGSGLAFRGNFFARSIEVRPASALVCDTALASLVP